MSITAFTNATLICPVGGEIGLLLAQGERRRRRGRGEEHIALLERPLEITRDRSRPPGSSGRDA